MWLRSGRDRSEGHLSPSPTITIVGGRQPSESDGGDLPRGIDHVLARAAVDRRFRERLLEDRERALESSGVQLSAAERGILLVTTPEQLVAMIDGVARNLVDRRGLFLRLAGVLGLFAGITVLAEGCGAGLKTKGCTSDRPPVKGEGTRPQTAGIPPDLPPSRNSRNRPPATDGSRADVPASREASSVPSKGKR